MDWSTLKMPIGLKSKEITVFTASQGTGKSVMRALDTKTVYYILSEHQQEFPHPVYKTENTNKEWALVKHRLHLMMLSNIVFSVDDNKIELIKHRNHDTSTHVLSDEELKQYRWYMLQAIGAP
jgi:hypothetical protein